MLELPLYCEKCGRFLGYMLNPYYIRGWFCDKCMDEIEKERQNYNYDIGDFDEEDDDYHY